MSVVALTEVAEKLGDYWAPRIVGEIDEAYVKVAKLKGTLTWHAHAREDEMFLVLKGRLKIEMEDHTVQLAAGEMFVVPKGVRHNPVADEECCVMLIEKKTTAHTGEVIMDKTRSIAEQLGPSSG